MAFIRNRNEERTGYQSGSSLTPDHDNAVDYVLVYRMDETIFDRLQVFKNKGYIVHFMTGIAWGAFTDYLYGEWDGVDHWDDAQTDRNGNRIMHGHDTPYMCPTLDFVDYLVEKFKSVIDFGVEAIHFEEPEYWDRAGYSESFKREYKMYYREDWAAPHESVDARYKCAKLKQYLYSRCIDFLSYRLKNYASRQSEDIRFYIPTHSLLNYTQWSIVSPEGKLADIPAIDGCIAQVWTGTSRERNAFNGKIAERTFETAYFEYGVMQELVKGTGRRMWFLHDPIEDNPVYDWDDYRKNYLATVTASLLHPLINQFEVCPWPNRVFTRKYPSDDPNAEYISSDYQTVLNNMFNTLGTIENVKQEGLRVGVLMADAQLYQREYPDSEFSAERTQAVGTVLSDTAELIDNFKNKLFKNKGDRELLLSFMQSNAFPCFYGLALPLLKYGIPVRPVLVDNARRYANYLDDYDILLASYSYLKPDYPDINATLCEWVQSGGKLIFVDDGFDPYNNIKSWWTGIYKNPAEHLYKLLDIELSEKLTIKNIGKGSVAVYNENPAIFCYSKENADILRDIFEKVVGKVEYKNHLYIERDRYVIAAVMDESVSDEPLIIDGIFADMYTADFAIVNGKKLKPGENTMLANIEKLNDLDIVGTSVRILSLEETNNKLVLKINGAKTKANIRIRVPKKLNSANIDGKNIPCLYDELSKTVLISFDNEPGEKTIIIEK